MLPEAFIFDLDGVVADTAEYHYRAWRRLADDLRLRFDEAFYERIKGVARLRTLELILKENNAFEEYTPEQIVAFADEKNNYYGELILELSPRDIQRGIMHLLEKGHDAGVKLGMVTISTNAPVVVKNLEIGSHFDFIIFNENPSRKRIEAEDFLACAQKLDAKQCVGFGNSEVCVKAIKEAGMFAVGIDLSKDCQLADYSLNGTKDLSFHKITDAFELSH